MKPIKIHNKDYYPVAERVKHFKETWDKTSFSITTEIIKFSDDQVLIKASIADSNGFVLATGHAEERTSWGKINQQSMIENCETSAVGRALAFLGIGVSDDIASADEMNRVKDKGDASYPQISMIEELLKGANIPEREVKQIERELITFTSDRASKCIAYLKDNQVEGDGSQASIQKELDKAIEKDEYKREKQD